MASESSDGTTYNVNCTGTVIAPTLMVNVRCPWILPVMKFSDQPSLVPGNLTAVTHFSVSSAMNLPYSAGFSVSNFAQPYRVSAPRLSTEAGLSQHPLEGTL